MPIIVADGDTNSVIGVTTDDSIVIMPMEDDFCTSIDLYIE